MRMGVMWVFVVGLAISTIGCAAISRTPAWVNGEVPVEFPKNNYITALSTGESLAAAQVAAKGELSRVFSAQLASEIELIDEETTVQGQAVSSSGIFDRTTISTDIVLEGVEVPLHWRDPKSGDIWALAVLERRKECMRIRSEGSDLITELAAYTNESRSTQNPLVAIRASVNAVRVGSILDGLQGRSRVLGSQCLTKRSVSTGKLKSEANQRLRSLSFVVNASDVNASTGQQRGSLPQLREQIAGNLSKLGFQVGPASGAQIIPIDARLRLSRVARGTEWIEYRYEGSAEVGSPVAGEPSMIVVDTDGAESHPEPSSARLRARRSGEKALARQLDQGIKTFLAEAEGY